MALPRFDFVITAGSWLGETLTTPNQNVVSFYFGADQIYFPPLRYEKRHLIVFHQPEKPRRMPNLVSAFLTEFHQKYPEWKITVVGSTLRDINLKFANQVGVLEPTQLAEIYRRGTFGLVLSATNASLIPLEMLSAGLPVITNSGPNSQWLGSYSGLFYSRPTVESLIDTFEGSVKEKSPITEKVPDWDAQLDEFWSKFRNGLTKGVIKSFFLEKSTSKSKT